MTDFLKRTIALLLCGAMLTGLGLPAFAVEVPSEEAAQQEVLPEEDVDLTGFDEEEEEILLPDLEEDEEAPAPVQIPEESEPEQEQSEPEPEPTTEEVLWEETVSQQISASGDDEDELFYDYMMQTALDNMSTVSRRRANYAPADRLDANTAAVYHYLLTIISDIAQGKRESTVIEITAEASGADWSWTAAELGLEKITDSSGKCSKAAMDEAAKRRFDFEKLLDTLLSDCPYALYWYDKTKGARLTYSISYNDSSLSVPSVTLSFSVSRDYSQNHTVGTYQMDTALASAATSAAETAATVADNSAGLSVPQRMAHYRDWICQEVSYNSAAANDSSTPYGDPWQLIWVFDGNAATNVVCEGYSKAFKYLCDLSRFSGVECRLVTGVTSGDHMWNVVEMPDGKNYLVDVTNYDSIGNTAFFLGGYYSGSVSEGYRVRYGTSTLNYVYDSETRSLFTQEELTLSPTAYSNPTLADCVITASDVIYNGQPQTPSLTVTLNSVLLVEGQDYTITQLANNTDIGEASFTITGMGSYSGTKSGTFQIKAIPMGGAVVTAPAQTYSGSALTPAVTVRVDGVTLVSGTDYTVAYSSNTNAGTASFTVTGMGHYEGTRNGTFQINAASLSAAQVSASNQTYTGAALTPAVTVTLNGKGLVAGSDFDVSYSNNTNAGTASFTVTGKGNYTGEVEGKFQISQNLISLAGASVTASDQVYTGAEQKPAVTVTLGETTLTAGTDYTVTFTKNVNAGTATITVLGKGNYTGTATGTFTIQKASQTLTVTGNTTMQVGTTQTLGVSGIGTITFTSSNPDVATVSTEGVVTAKTVGTVNLTVQAAGDQNHNADSSSILIQVTPISIAGASVSAEPQVYTGSALTPAVTVMLGDQILVENTDYTVAYADNINAGNATVTVTGTGNYIGTAAKNFTIAKASITPKVTIKSWTYGQSAQNPSVTGNTGSGKVTYTYAKKGTTSFAATKPTNAGSYTVKATVAATDNYNGATATADFTIAKASITPKVTINSWTYGQSAQNPSVTGNTGSGKVTYTYAKKGTTSFAATEPANAGAYTVKATVAATANYNGATATADFTIAKAAQTLTVSAPATVVKGKTVNVTAKGTGALTYISSNNKIATVSAKGVVKGIAPGTVTITVKAAGNANYKAASKTVKITVYLPTPTISKVENINGGVKITVGKVAGAAKYRLFYKIGSGKWTKIADISSTTYTWKQAKSGTTYTFTVRCVSKDGKTNTSDFNKTGKTHTYVATPTLSSVKSTKAKTATATWKKVTGVTGYQIQYSTSKTFASGNKTVTVKGAGSTSKSIGSLTGGKTFYVRIRSYKTVSGNNAYSAWSGAKSVKISSGTSNSSSTTNTATNIVYVTPSGSKYHRSDCSTLSRSKSLTSLRKAQAQSMGYDACKVCKP